MSNDLTVAPTADKGLILNAGLLWTFSALSRFEVNAKYVELARRAYDFLDEHFWDDRFGGAFWSVDARGRVVDDKKKICGRAFYVYALSEYYLATQRATALRTRGRT
jgi:mannobiose 2-epimerase